MPVPLTVNGIVYQYPKVREKNWGQNATNWASAVTNLVSNLRSSTAPIATAGVLRLGVADAITWRNTANTLNASLMLNASDQLVYNDGVTSTILSLAAAGNVQNLNPSTDNAIVRFDGVLGTVIQNSGVIINDSNNVTGVNDLTVNNNLTVTGLINGVNLLKALVPIGTIIAHEDFNGAIIPDPVYWVPCDGGTYTIGGSARTTPDMSNRYLVGLGTEGGGDNDTAPWSMTPVGNASHQTNLAHTHDVNIASFSSASAGTHSHTVDSHAHGDGSLFAAVDLDSGEGRLYYKAQTGTFTSTHRIGSISDDGATSASRPNGFDVEGTTGTASPGTNTVSAHTHTIDPPNTTSTSALSVTQSIQPRSIPVRWYVRAV